MMFIRLIQLVVFLIGVFAFKEAMSQTRWLCGSLVVSGLLVPCSSDSRSRTRSELTRISN